MTGPGARPDRAHPHEKPRHRHSGWAAQRHPEATSTRAKRDSPREPRERPALVGGARGFDSREQRTKEHHKREGSCMGSWGQSVSDRPQRPGRAALYGCGEGCASDDTARGQAGAVAPADDDAKAGHGPAAVAPPHPAPPGATTRSRARRSKPAEPQLDSFQPPLLMVPTEADAVPDREITVTPRRTPTLRSSVPSCPQAGAGFPPRGGGWRTTRGDRSASSRPPTRRSRVLARAPSTRVRCGGSAPARPRRRQPAGAVRRARPGG